MWSDLIFFGMGFVAGYMVFNWYHFNYKVKKMKKND